MTKLHRIKLGIYSILIVFLLILIGILQIPRQQRNSADFAIQIDHSQILEFELMSNTYGRMRFVKNEASWNIEHEGQENLGRDARINDFLRLLGTIKIVRTASNSGSLPEFGLELENNGTQIMVNHGLGQNYVYKFGNPAALGNEYYFQGHGSSQVLVVSGELGFYLNQSPAYWTELRFWPDGIQENNVLGINLEGFNGNGRSYYRDTDTGGQDIWIATHKDGEIDSRGLEFLRTAASLEFAQALNESSWNDLVRDSIPTGIIEIIGIGGLGWTAEILNSEGVFFARVTDGVKNPRYGILSTWRLDEFWVTQPTESLETTD